MNTELESTTPKVFTGPVVCFLSGLGTVGVFFLLLLLPGQNIHGGTLTGITLLFGLAVPPVCFVAGLVAAFRRPGPTRRVGVALNLAGLLLDVLWATGALYTAFE
jgi:hypothetical protein